MSCAVPCKIGTFCNSGGAQPYSVCVSGDPGQPPRWQPLPTRREMGTPPLPICPINSGPEGACAINNSCFVAGLDGRYRCVQFAERRPWHPAGPGWWYEEQIKPPAIFPRISGIRSCPKTEIPGITSQPSLPSAGGTGMLSRRVPFITRGGRSGRS